MRRAIAASAIATAAFAGTAGFAYADPEIGNMLSAQPASAPPPTAVPPPPASVPPPPGNAEEPAPPADKPPPPADEAAPPADKPPPPADEAAPPPDEAAPPAEPPAEPEGQGPGGDAYDPEPAAPQPEAPQPEAPQPQDPQPMVPDSEDQAPEPDIDEGLDPKIKALIDQIKKSVTKKAEQTAEERMNALLKYLGCPAAGKSASQARTDLTPFAAQMDETVRTDVCKVIKKRMKKAGIRARVPYRAADRPSDR